MCQLFIGADSELWESRTKSLRIDGAATSVRIENFFWATLEEIAIRDGMTVNQLITKLYHESIDAEHDLGNFTSFLRVCCARYHALMAAGDVSNSLDDALGTMAAADILSREKSRRQSSMLLKAEHLAAHELN
jgi:predicted DNA-binding ribbon-helix-helix protein